MSIRLKYFTTQPTNPPLRQYLRPHLLIKRNGIHIPIEHHPLHSAVPHFRRLSSHRRQQHLPQSLPPITLPHKYILDIKPGFRQKGRIVGEKQNEPTNNHVISNNIDIISSASERFSFGIVYWKVEEDGVEERGKMGVGGG